MSVDIDGYIEMYINGRIKVFDENIKNKLNRYQALLVSNAKFIYQKRYERDLNFKRGWVGHEEDHLLGCWYGVNDLYP